MELHANEYFVHLQNVLKSGVLTNKFPYSISLQDDCWECGLLEFSLSQKFDNVINGGDFVQVLYRDEMVANLKIPAGRYLKLTEYADAMRKEIRTKGAKDFVKLKVEGSTLEITFLQDETKLLFSERAGEHFNLSDEDMKVGVLVDDFKQEVFNTNFNPLANLHRFFISSPYVTRHMFQNSTLPLLGSCPAGSYLQEDPKAEFFNSVPIYFQLSTNKLDGFSVQILDEKGRQLELDHHEAYCLLHLKKKNAI